MRIVHRLFLRPKRCKAVLDAYHPRARCGKARDHSGSHIYTSPWLAYPLHWSDPR